MNISLLNDFNYENNYYLGVYEVSELTNVTFNVVNTTRQYVKRWVRYSDSPEIELNGPTVVELPDTKINLIFYEQNEMIATGFIDTIPKQEMNMTSELKFTNKSINNITLYMTYLNMPDWNYSYADYYFESSYDTLGFTGNENLTVYYCEDYNLITDSCDNPWTEADCKIYQDLFYFFGSCYNINADVIAIGEYST